MKQKVKIKYNNMNTKYKQEKNMKNKMKLYFKKAA